MCYSTKRRSRFYVFHFTDYTVLHVCVIIVVLGNLRKTLILADQSQCISKSVSQITLLQFRISQITQYPYPAFEPFSTLDLGAGAYGKVGGKCL